jgi:hypothetical protein
MRISLSKEQKGDLTKSSTELILDALTAPTTDLPWEQLVPLKRINDLLKETKKASSKSADISDLLWSIWSNAKNYEGELISSAWQQQALAGGNRGAAADQNLDALITLF